MGYNLETWGVTAVAAVVLLGVLRWVWRWLPQGEGRPSKPPFCPNCRLFIGGLILARGTALHGRGGASHTPATFLVRYTCKCGYTTFWDASGGLLRHAFGYTEPKEAREKEVG